MCLAVGEDGACTLARRTEGGAQDGADRFRRKVEGEGKVRFESVAQAGQGLAAVDGKVALAPLSDPRTLWTVD